MIHEERQQRVKSKSAKFAPQAQKEILVGYDGHTIYRVFLKEENQIIWVKNIRIHEDAVLKTDTTLPTYEAIMTKEHGGNSTTSSSSDSVDCSSDMPPVSKLERGKKKRGCPQKVDVNIMITKFQKLEKLVSESLTDTFTTSDNATEKNAINSMALLAQSLTDIEASDLETFALVSSFDLLKPGSYKAAMSEPHAAEWSKGPHEEYDSLMANDIWEFVKVEDVKPGHTILSKK